MQIIQRNNPGHNPRGHNYDPSHENYTENCIKKKNKRDSVLHTLTNTTRVSRGMETKRQEDKVEKERKGKEKKKKKRAGWQGIGLVEKSELISSANNANANPIQALSKQVASGSSFPFFSLSLSFPNLKPPVALAEMRKEALWPLRVVVNRKGEKMREIEIKNEREKNKNVQRDINKKGATRNKDKYKCSDQ